MTPGQADEDDDEEETEVNDVNDGYSLDIISPQASFELSPNQHHRNLNSCQSSKKRFGVKTVSKSSPQLLDLSLGPAQSTPHDSTPHSYTPVQRIEVMPASRRRASIDIPDSSRDLRKWQSLPATSRGRGRSNSTACYDVVSLVFAVDPEPYAL